MPTGPLLSPIDALLLPMGTVAAFVAVVALGLWIDRRTERLPLLVAVWSGNTVLYLWGHHHQAAAASPPAAVHGASLAWTSAVLMVPMLVGVVHALTGTRPRRAVVVGLGVVSVLGIGAIWLTRLVLTDGTYWKPDLLGYGYLGVRPGLLMPVFVLYTFGTFLYGIRLIARSSVPPLERRAFLVSLVAYFALGLNDVGHAAELFTSVRVFDLGFVFVALGLVFIGVRRYNLLHRHLEAVVVERTRELRARQAELTALQAGQGAVGAAALTRAPARAEDVRITPPPGADLPLPWSGRAMRDELDRQPFRAVLAVPLISKAAVLGAISVYWREPHPVDERETRLLTALARHAALAIQNARLYEGEARARRQAEAALAQVTRLQGLLPICAWCKKVRNDQNYWEQIESYISQRSATTFRYGICPECRDRLRAGLA